MAKENFREIKASEKIIAVQDKPKDRDTLNKKNKKRILESKQPKEANHNFIKDLKTQLTYGDTGYGVILDKKV